MPVLPRNPRTRYMHTTRRNQPPLETCPEGFSSPTSCGSLLTLTPSVLFQLASKRPPALHPAYHMLAMLTAHLHEHAEYTMRRKENANKLPPPGGTRAPAASAGF
eukprot:8883295-Karenia_brevis.AAC.1